MKRLFESIIYCNINKKMEWPHQSLCRALSKEICKKSEVSLRIATHLAVTNILVDNKVNLYFCYDHKKIFKFTGRSPLIYRFL